MGSRIAAVAALATLAACGGQAVDGGGAPIDPPDGISYSIGYACGSNGSMVCGCYEFCDPANGDTCRAGPYRGDGVQCGPISSACWSGACCLDWMSCPDDGRACTRTTCAADGVTCTHTEYCPPRNACETGPGVCGAGDLCDYTAVTLTNDTACGANVWCFQGLCRPGCFISGSYHGPGTFLNACMVCDPATSRTGWTPVAAGTGCGAESVCLEGICERGCLIGGVLRTIGALNPANECEACAAASGTDWTNTTAGCTDDGDPCTTDRCGGDGTCHHTPGACAAAATDSMFGCNSAGGGGLLALLLAAPLLLRARRQRAGALLGALLLLAPALASAAPPAARPPADGIALFTFKAGPEVSEKTAEFVTQAFSSALHARGIATLSQEDVKAALGFEKQRKMLGCESDACFAEIGGALGVRRLVTGSLGRLGDSLVANAQLVDTANAGVERRHVVRLPASRGDEGFLEAIPELVEALFPQQSAVEATRPFAIALSGWGELHKDAGGAGLLLARWSFARSLRASAGLLVTPKRLGATARLTWIPWNAGGRIYPLLAVEAMALEADPISPGIGAAVGVEWRATPRIDLALEIPVVRLTSVLEGMRTTYAFAAASAAWRF